MGNEGTEADFIASLQAPEPAYPFPDPSDIEPGSVLLWNGEEWISVRVAGCKDLHALNFDASALIDDGTCIDACINETALNYHGHDYSIVAIAGDCWFQENLQTETYTNGDALLSASAPSEWIAVNEGALAAFGDDLSNVLDYGFLYNWAAVEDARGICPVGWHVSTSDEWSELAAYLGGDQMAGTAMKATPWDPIPWDGSNSSGFSARPAGGRSAEGEDVDLGSLGVWFMAQGAAAAYSILNSNDQSAVFADNCIGCGLSIRCVKDCEDTDGDGVCNADEVTGCTDATALNFNATATDDSGDCIYPVFECGTSVSYNGFEYSTASIGNQCWFTQNLHSEYYANGEVIPGGLTSEEWASTTSGAQAVYGTGDSPCDQPLCDEVANLEDFGRLYNFLAVDDSRGLCPSNWHVPTDAEWAELLDFLGGESVSGTLLKSSPGDSPSWNGSNASGFSAVPGGIRGFEGGFLQASQKANFWTSTQNGWGAYGRKINGGSSFVNQTYGSLLNGSSVRCIRD